jgi:curli biogenesis system outer membrane secretion channel CsgG
MRKLALCLGLAMALPLVAPAHALAQTKVRIAIWEFDNNSQGSWWFSNQLGPAVRNHVDTAFSEHAQLARQFSVVERDKLALVLKEQGLATSGALDPATAARVGQLLGVRYIVVGAVDSFTINNTRAGTNRLGGLAVSSVSAETTISMRVIDTTTGERLVSVNAEGKVNKGGGAFRGTSLSRDAEWGLANEAAEKAAEELVKKFVAGNYASRFVAEGVNAQVEGKVIKVEGDRAWINLGTSAGLKVGDRFTVFSVGEALIDPDTGANLGSPTEQTGTAEVVEAQEKFAIVKVTGTVDAKSLLRKASGT